MAPRLILFDIDGTLVRPCGLGRRSLERVFQERYDHDRAFAGVRFHGRTDPEILREGLGQVGADVGDLPALVARYLVLLEEEVSRHVSLLLPGVRELLGALRVRPETMLGLVTGNVKRAAAIKLSRDGLWTWFPVGAFGDEGDSREDLVRLAWRRARELGHPAAEGRQVVLVGDTENDILAARGAGVVAVAVATGVDDRETLARHRPDHLLESLVPAARFLEEVLR